MSQKTFLLGVGCQKGGTTWLHDYLSSHPQCDLGFKKEYHVFDVVFGGIFTNFKDKRIEKLQKIKNKRFTKAKQESEAFQKKVHKLSKLVDFYTDLNEYAKYFDELHSASGNTRLVGDITPSYCVLKAADYQTVRKLLEARGFTVKVVFLMRDPIERIHSAVRMKIRRKGDQLHSKRQNERDFFASSYTKARHRSRSQYEKIIPQIGAAFEAEEIFFGFFETLFTEESVRRLTEFLWIDYIEPDFSKRINASPKTRSLDPDLVAEARQFYEPTYAYCADRFGADTLEKAWGYAGAGSPA